MPHPEPFHCRNCGQDFTIEVLSREEASKARDKGDNVGPIRCPTCGRTDLVKLKAA